MKWTAARGRYAGLRKHRPPDDPVVVEAARDLKAARLEEHVRTVLDSAPPLSPEQVDRIAAILLQPPLPGRPSTPEEARAA